VSAVPFDVIPIENLRTDDEVCFMPLTAFLVCCFTTEGKVRGFSNFDLGLFYLLLVSGICLNAGML